MNGFHNKVSRENPAAKVQDYLIHMVEVMDVFRHNHRLSSYGGARSPVRPVAPHSKGKALLVRRAGPSVYQSTAALTRPC